MFTHDACSSTWWGLFARQVFEGRQTQWVDQSLRNASFSPAKDILVFSDGLLRQAFELGLFVDPETLDPLVHVSKHRRLDLGLSVVKVWVESVFPVNNFRFK